jgi:formamidopyrimidine-DNA glycosylase
MPELPDVEIARRRLQSWLVGAKVSAALCMDARLTGPRPPRAFTRTLMGKTVDAVARKGRWLCFNLDDGSRVFSHLGMTGGWLHAAMDAPALRSERARIDVVRRSRCGSHELVLKLDTGILRRTLDGDPSTKGTRPTKPATWGEHAKKVSRF